MPSLETIIAAKLSKSAGGVQILIDGGSSWGVLQVSRGSSEGYHDESGAVTKKRVFAA